MTVTVISGHWQESSTLITQMLTKTFLLFYFDLLMGKAVAVIFSNKI